MPKATVPEARGAVAPSLIDLVSSNDVIDAEAKVTPPVGRLAAAARVVEEHGQAGFAVCLSNGKAKEAMDGAGTAVNVLNAHAGLVVEAREQVRTVVGAGRDDGVGRAAVTALADVIVDATYTTGAKVHKLDKTWTEYPRLLALITVLGGSEATDPYAPTAESLGAGCEGDPTKMPDILEAVRALEDILVAIYHEGCLVDVNKAGDFGLYKFIKASSKILNVDRTLQLFGRVMAAIDDAMDTARTTTLAWASGKASIDIVALVEQVRLHGLPAFNEDQRGEERVSKNLAAHGLTPEVMARLASPPKPPSKWQQGQTQPQVQPQAQQQTQQQAAKGKKGQAVLAVAQVAGAAAVQLSPVVAQVAQAAPQSPASILKRGSEVKLELPPGFSMEKSFTDPQVAAVRAFEALPGMDKRVCPWYNIFGYCKKATTDECDRCPSGRVCTQAELDTVRATITYEPVAKVVITGPPVKNPNPGDGSRKEKKRASFAPKGDG